MKKKQRIGMVTIQGDMVTAFDTEGVEVKLTRSQRKIFMKNKFPNLINDIKHEFQVTDIFTVISNSFFIKKDDKVIYTY